jgi:hypothetical protein
MDWADDLMFGNLVGFLTYVNAKMKNGSNFLQCGLILISH